MGPIQDIWAAGTSSLFEHWREETFMILYQCIWKGHGASLQIYHYRVSSFRQEHTYRWCRSSMAPYSPCACCVCSTRSYFASPSNSWPKRQRPERHTNMLLQSYKSLRWLIPMCGCVGSITGERQRLAFPWKAQVWQEGRWQHKKRAFCFRALLRQRKRSNISAVNVGWQVIPGKYANSAQQWIVTVYNTFLIIFSACILGILLHRKIPR